MNKQKNSVLCGTEKALKFMHFSVQDQPKPAPSHKSTVTLNLLLSPHFSWASLHNQLTPQFPLQSLSRFLRWQPQRTRPHSFLQDPPSAAPSVLRPPPLVLPKLPDTASSYPPEAVKHFRPEPPPTVAVLTSMNTIS